MTDRDTKFLGFAELLVLQFDGLSLRYKDWPDWKELDRQMKLAIAQYAYDLVEYATQCISDKQLEEGFMFSQEHMFECTYDLTQSPESPTPLPDAPTEQAPSSD